MLFPDMLLYSPKLAWNFNLTIWHIISCQIKSTKMIYAAQGIARVMSVNQ